MVLLSALGPITVATQTGHFGYPVWGQKSTSFGDYKLDIALFSLLLIMSHFPEFTHQKLFLLIRVVCMAGMPSFGSSQYYTEDYTIMHTDQFVS